MPILIEIIFFIVVGATGVWTYIKNTTTAVSAGVKKKLEEREISKGISKFPISRYANQFTQNEKYTLFGLLIILINSGDQLPNYQETELLNTLATIFKVNLNRLADVATNLDQNTVSNNLRRKAHLIESDFVLGVSLFIIVQMALVDGNFTDTEFGFIEYLRNVLHLDGAAFENIVINWGKKLDLDHRN